MVDILLALGIWYGLGALAAAWAVRKGHAPDLWFIGAALWGAIMVPLVIVARLLVVARPALLPLPVRSKNGLGVHVLLLVHVDDSPKQALAALAEASLRPTALDVVVVVSEEASSRLIASPEIAKAEQSLRRILRGTPPVDTGTAITSVSGIEQLTRSGWQADLVIATHPVLAQRLRLGRLRRESLDRTEPRRVQRRPPRRPRPATRSKVPQGAGAA